MTVYIIEMHKKNQISVFRLRVNYWIIVPISLRVFFFISVYSHFPS